MANHFNIPNASDDGKLTVIRYRDLLPNDHPARYIERFISDMDVSSFEARYKVGPGQKGRAPKGIRTMLGVILYGLYCRKYSARKIDYATEHHADFWFFTLGGRISHDKITEFMNLHGADIHKVFLETITLAQTNGLLNFKSLYMDGFFLKANASKRKSYSLQGLSKKETKLAAALDEALAEIKSQTPDPILEARLNTAKKDLELIDSLKKRLNNKIQTRAKDKAPYQVKEMTEKMTINATDGDSDLMKQKDDSVANAYLEVYATDSKADIIVASSIAGHNDEPHMALNVFEQAQKNCQGKGEYQNIVADSNFTTSENCQAFEAKEASMIGPTRSHEQHSAPGAITFSYDETKQCILCSCGATFQEEERYYDKYKKTTIVVFSNKVACQGCKNLSQCTKSKEGYRRIRMDIRRPAQQRTQERYKSEEGKALYKKRSHAAETYQGDKKLNGSFVQLLYRGLEKVKAEALWLDIVWNLRRIFNAKQGHIAWSC